MASDQTHPGVKQAPMLCLVTLLGGCCSDVLLSAGLPISIEFFQLRIDSNEGGAADDTMDLQLSLVAYAFKLLPDMPSHIWLICLCCVT